MAHRLYNFDFRPDDIVVMTYPKCGTTWMQEIIWGMTHLDELEEADRLPITYRTFFIDSDALYLLKDQMKDRYLMDRFHTLCPDGRPEQGVIMQSCSAQPPQPTKPRIIKTHFPLSLYRPDLLDKCKVVYVCRNPKDACVSYHHHCRLVNTYKFEGSFEAFAKAFMAGDVFYGKFWDHVAHAWQRRRHPNLRLVFYEDLQLDGLKQLEHLGSFLGLQLSQEQLQRVAEHASFSRMKGRDAQVPITLSSSTNGAVGGFFRKGITGDWRNVASAELDTVMEEWIREHAGSLGISFKYAL
ncbi:sulfotransferase 1A3-like isoform X2 [Penaeus japonicus]|nr:sulfotransferase 1A3-like isoform X2 [Penaeus japonicus]XP_042886681.1 sulfotransferase 1A3-like isoform X2 [Penaeus japonicus]